MPEDRIYVCPARRPVVEDPRASAQCARAGYLLFLGTLEPRKNLGALLDAYQRLRRPDAGSSHDSLLPGAPRRRQPSGWREWKLLRWRATCEYVGYVRDEERESLYAGARAARNAVTRRGFRPAGSRGDVGRSSCGRIEPRIAS